jgi:hypothetical protein
MTRDDADVDADTNDDARLTEDILRLLILPQKLPTLLILAVALSRDTIIILWESVLVDDNDDDVAVHSVLSSSFNGSSYEEYGESW